MSSTATAPATPDTSLIDTALRKLGIAAEFTFVPLTGETMIEMPAASVVKLLRLAGKRVK